MTIIWCIIPEIWSVTDKIFCHSAPFLPFCLLTTQKIKILKKWKKCQETLSFYICTINHMMYGCWDMEHDTQYLSFWNIFLPFYPPDKLKNQNFQIIKKEPGDIIILQMCTINDNHEMCFLRYGVWQIFFCHFAPFFDILPPEKPKKSKFWKNENY